MMENSPLRPDFLEPVAELLRSIDCGDQDLDLHDLVEDCLDGRTPFLLVVHEIARLRKEVMGKALDPDRVAETREVLDLYDHVEEEFAAFHLDRYLQNLEQRCHLRLSHIAKLTDKNLLVHFEKHLEWIKALASATRQGLPALLPEPDPYRCDFGRWLHDEGFSIIRDQSHQKRVEKIHARLHEAADSIRRELETGSSRLRLYILLKRAELKSLELGNEVSLINNVVIMSSFNRDSLTGLLARRSMDKVVFNQLEIAKATEKPFSLILCDLDHFKVLNDTWGHVSGDEALKHFSTILRREFRQSDLIFRFGGEEFLIVLPSLDHEQASRLAERVREAVEAEPLQEGENAIRFTASFGVKEIRPESYQYIDRELVIAVIRETDAQLYRAKSNGRNQVC